MLEFLIGLGRLGGLILLGLGGLLIAGFVFELDVTGEGHVALVGLGSALVGLGVLRLVLRTSSERMDAMIADDDTPADFAPLTLEGARTLPVPYYTCTDCKVLIETDVLCPQCLKSTWCVAVLSEADRALVLAAIE